MDECFRRLINEIHANSKQELKINKIEPSNNEKSGKLMTEHEVSVWLNEKEINPIIVENIVPANGEILAQLYEMLCTCPEFFFNSITSNQPIKTRETAIFANELKKLFL